MSFDFDPNKNAAPQGPQAPQTGQTTTQPAPQAPAYPNPNQVGMPPVSPPPPAQTPLEYLTKLKVAKSGNSIVGGCSQKVLQSGEMIPALFFCISKAKDGSGYHLSVKVNQPQPNYGQGNQGVPF